VPAAEEAHPLKQYLLSSYQPDGPAPAPDVLEPVTREVRALNQDLRAAGARVFDGGLGTAALIRCVGGARYSPRSASGCTRS
jgi:hypothetical protein